ncbi:hypothetical protein EZV62_002299 [Acer yangbiense]|uniref:Magnesium transporter n=1 Tax=Acer yangbiense TaxID=1000413 RepID=A0A5C7IWQ0_9ROSI|nr:hypothetical protein EZV62_002299 [Acer yangbiense]
MALVPQPNVLQFSVQSSSTSAHYLLFGSPSQISSLKTRSLPLFPIAVKVSSRVKCLTKSTEENWSSEPETVATGDDDDVDGVREDAKAQIQNITSPQRTVTSSSDSSSLGIREPVYEVVEVKSNGKVSNRKINRRQLLKSSGLRPRDIRSIDPSLFMTNSMPSLLVREHAILLNLGSLRAIAMREHALIFDYNRKGGKAFIDTLLHRLNPRSNSGGPCMPFEIEMRTEERKSVTPTRHERAQQRRGETNGATTVPGRSTRAEDERRETRRKNDKVEMGSTADVVEAALLSRVQRLEQILMDIEPRVQGLLEVLPNRLTADVLEQLRISKQALVELSSRAAALRQMLLDLLEDPHEIRRICIMGRNCTLRKGSDSMECSVSVEKQIAEEEEEEIEMLLENYLQRCESCHGQSERLLDSAKEMEDSIAVNLSSRRLEVSKVELLLQVGAFCVTVGALISGIFGMNLRSYLEEHVFAFWLTTAGIIVGAVVAFFIMYSYLKARKIL